MKAEPKTFLSGDLVSASRTIVHSTVGGDSARVTRLQMRNEDPSNSATVTLSIIPAGEETSFTEYVIETFEIPPGQTKDIESARHFISPPYFMAVQSTTAACRAFASGVIFKG